MSSDTAGPGDTRDTQDARDTHDARDTQDTGATGRVNPLLAVLAWLWVLVPFGYGLYQLVGRIPALFG